MVACGPVYSCGAPSSTSPSLWDDTILMSLEDESQKCRGYFPTLGFASHRSEQAFLLLPSTLRIKGLGEVRNVGA